MTLRIAFEDKAQWVIQTVAKIIPEILEKYYDYKLQPNEGVSSIIDINLRTFFTPILIF